VTPRGRSATPTPIRVHRNDPPLGRRFPAVGHVHAQTPMRRGRRQSLSSRTSTRRPADLRRELPLREGRCLARRPFIGAPEKSASNLRPLRVGRRSAVRILTKCLQRGLCWSVSDGGLAVSPHSVPGEEPHKPTADTKRPAMQAFSRAAEGLRTLDLLFFTALAFAPQTTTGTSNCCATAGAAEL
jgi:hypothetical protein